MSYEVNFLKWILSMDFFDSIAKLMFVLNILLSVLNSCLTFERIFLSGPLRICLTSSWCLIKLNLRPSLKIDLALKMSTMCLLMPKEIWKSLSFFFITWSWMAKRMT